MGIRLNLHSKRITHRKKPTKKMQRQVINQVRSSHKLFRTAKMSERRSHQSIKEAENLRLRPVKDFATWYETCGISGETKVFLQKISCGNTEMVNLGKDYPEMLPEEFKNMDVNNLREYLLNLKMQS